MGRSDDGNDHHAVVDSGSRGRAHREKSHGGSRCVGAGGIYWNDIAMLNSMEGAMTELFDAEAAASELMAYVEEVMLTPEDGASLGAVLGAYTFKAVLHDAGYAIVPLAPTPGMVSAFRHRWFRNFSHRYDAMVCAAWPGPRGREDEGLLMSREVMEQSRAISAASLLALAVGAAAFGAVAIGVLAIGRLAVGRLVIKKAHFNELEVDGLTVRRFRVVEHEGGIRDADAP